VQSCSATVAVGSCTIAFTTAGDRTVTAKLRRDRRLREQYVGERHADGGRGRNHDGDHGPHTESLRGGPGGGGHLHGDVGGGTPAGNVTVSDGTVNCVGTVAAGSCT